VRGRAPGGLQAEPADSTHGRFPDTGQYGLVPAAAESDDSCVSYEPHRFEDFAPGQAYEFGKRIISREDIAAFADVSDDHTALHCDDGYAATTPFGSVVSHGVLNVAAATGLAYRCGLFEGTVLAVLSLETRFERPVFPGDELTLRMTVKELDPRPRPDRGRVTFGVELLNQAGKKVVAGDWTLLLRRAGVPAGSAPPSSGKPVPPD